MNKLRVESDDTGMLQSLNNRTCFDQSRFDITQFHDVSSQFSSAFPLFGSQVADCPNFISELITLMVGEADELAWLPRALGKPMVAIVIPCLLPEGEFHVGDVGSAASESFR